MLNRLEALAGMILTTLLLGSAIRADDPRRAKDSGRFFSEGFDDGDLLKRSWYDGDRFAISNRDPQRGLGCLEYALKAGGTTPASSSGLRRLFEPTEVVHLRLHIRLSKTWKWTGKPFHPHLIQFLTTENGKFHGPAASHLTMYVEPWEGRLRLAAQDILNKDKPHGLTQGPLKGGFNGQSFDSKDVLFKNDQWHCVEAMFQLNTLDPAKDAANADGVVRAWFDDQLVVERKNVVLRSPDFPKMKFNQILLLPYFGEGLLPQAQSLWIDELSVGTRRFADAKQK